MGRGYVIGSLIGVIEAVPAAGLSGSIFIPRLFRTLKYDQGLRVRTLVAALRLEKWRLISTLIDSAA